MWRGRRPRRWGVVALPRSPHPDLRVFLPDAVSISIPGARSGSGAATPAIVARIPEPVVLVVLLLELSFSLLHPHPVLVARTLAHVDWRVRAPAVAERFAIFPGARSAGTYWGYGGVGERTGEDVVQAKGRWLRWYVLWTRKLVTILFWEVINRFVSERNRPRDIHPGLTSPRCPLSPQL